MRRNDLTLCFQTHFRVLFLFFKWQILKFYEILQKKDVFWAAKCLGLTWVRLGLLWPNQPFQTRTLDGPTGRSDQDQTGLEPGAQISEPCNLG